MFKIVLAAMMFLSAACYDLSAWSAQPGPQDVGGSQFNTSREQIGELRLGLSEKGLTGKVPCELKKDKEVLEGATGEYVQTWKYPGCGVELKMSSEGKGKAKTVESITITSPCDLATSGGIRIGSAESEVVKAYGRYKDKEGGAKKGKKFVAGSIYDGMIFDFKDGKVVRIFLGSAAE